MKKASVLLILLMLVIQSCSSSKNTVANSGHKITLKTEAPTQADKILWTAVTYKGTPYKYGGVDETGMDCSGLIYTSFQQRGILFPRTTHEMFTQGENIELQEVQRGDLVFFKTIKTAYDVSHVGLVTSVINNEIKFIHSSTSQGVIVSSLNQKYWKKHFVKAKRVL